MDATTTTAAEPTPTQSSPSEGFNFNTYLLSFAAAVIIYALSPGPIAKFLVLGKRPVTTQAFRITFAPLGYAYDNSAAVHRFYDWYFKNVWHLS